ncbi:MAG: arylsulfatase A-like enzyme [Candidatus Paceibacteria bacterium]|jgi:arylsulfatase A-like enzyme
MNNRWLAPLFSLVLLGMWSNPAKRPLVKGSERPNLLLIVTDDQPHDAMGCAGHEILRTPNMDALAARGTRFTHAFVTTPICAASRASIFSGRYERSHGYTFGQPALAEEIVRTSYPALLRRSGYRVGFVGKLGVKISKQGREEMFESNSPGTSPYFRKRSADSPKEGDSSPARHLTERNADRAIEFLRVKDERPFCLSLSFNAPHAEDGNPDQYVWPESCNEHYLDAEIPPPLNSDPGTVENLPGFLQNGLNRERWKWRFDTPEKHARMVKGYYRMLSGVDLAIGRLLAALEEQGLSEDTVIFFIGDNGYFLGERGFAGKWTMHDRSTRVPLILLDPRREAAQRGVLSDAFALNVDIAPTLLELAGVEVPAAMQGRSLYGLAQAPEEDRRVEVFTEHLWDFDRIPRTEGLRTRKWKYIRYLDHPEYEELYDIELDPNEERNLASDKTLSGQLEELRARCTRAANQARG